MRYYVTIGSRTFEVELAGESVRVDGRPVTAELAALARTPVRHLLVDAKPYGVVARTGEGRGRWSIHLDGHRFEVEVVDERTRAIRAVAGVAATSAGPKPVRAPMPGLVVRVEVEPGQRVKAGQGVVIIEAMKMENELKAEAAGVVSRVAVVPGQAVEKGAVLVEFEAE
ncbi:MAG TPA: biotin/lipoyl-containing protein [Longimicrobiales bacterium]|jgi:biotin carboxyl carrier protein